MTKRPSQWYRLARRASRSQLWCLFLVCWLLAACGAGSTSPVGPLGAPLNLRASLPAAVAQRFPTDEGTEAYSVTHQVCNTPGRIQFNWHVAAEDNRRYIVSIDTAVVEAAPNYQFTMLPLGRSSMFDADNGIQSQTYDVVVDCRGQFLMSQVQSTFQIVIRADGTSEVH